ncbi:MAG: uroporphyrinogen-III C-methyltransferase [Alphaproteobacteria bacterium]
MINILKLFNKNKADNIANLSPTFEKGTVWITGAGPGDIGLLTIHAINGLKSADVIVYDALVNEDILNLASCEKIYAGKRGGKPSTKQDDICDTLVKLAKQGKKVLRLKGGDPFIFGRGGEEAIVLKDNGINFRVIPGITAGIGGMAYAGIPATHRETNYSITFVTGHASTGEIPDEICWNSLTAPSQVVVLYMALKHINHITDKLIGAGKDANTPCAIVENATTPQMRVETGQLKDLPNMAKNFSPPAIIVIGKVVNLNETIGWIK